MAPIRSFPLLMLLASVILVIIRCSSFRCQAVEGPEDTALIRSMVERREWDRIHAYADKLEEKWLLKPDVSYFVKLADLCEAVNAARDLKPVEYMYLQDLASRIMAKPFKRGVGLEKEDGWRARYQVAYMLLHEPSILDSKALSPEVFATLRSRTTAILALFCLQVNSVYNANYIRREAYRNGAEPEVNIDNEPIIYGMSPEGIKNPVTRKSYEEAIARNSMIIQEGNIQRLLKDIIKDDYPAFISRIEDLYLREPESKDELEAYRSMGLFEKKESEKKGKTK